MTNFDPNIYGYVNGEPVYTRDEFIFKSRGCGPLKTDEEILAFAEKATHNWYNAGWHRTFEDYYLGSYCLDEPMRSLTTAEYTRLKEMQKELRAKKKAEEDAKEWRYDHTVYYADNSEEEVWINKFGEEKTIMTVGPHGDLC